MDFGNHTGSVVWFPCHGQCNAIGLARQPGRARTRYAASQPGTFRSFGDCTENDRVHEEGQPNPDTPCLRSRGGPRDRLSEE